MQKRLDFNLGSFKKGQLKLWLLTLKSKGAMKLHFMHFVCEAISLFSTDLCNSAFST